MKEFDVFQFITNYSEYLVDGVYKFNDNKTQLVIIDCEWNYVKDVLNQCTNIKNAHLFTDDKTIEIKSKNKKFRGKLVLFPSHRYGIKFFSEKEILTLYEDKERLRNDLSNRLKMSKIFTTPHILSVAENSILEERIYEDANYRIDIPTTILQNYIYYFSNSRENINIELKCIPYFTNIKFPEIIQHGDLWSGNIIIGNNNIYVVDYETVSQCFFYMIFINLFLTRHISREIINI